jgi:hypothetical protein
VLPTVLEAVVAVVEVAHLEAAVPLLEGVAEERRVVQAVPDHQVVRAVQALLQPQTAFPLLLGVMP